jgi:hypothetical protein
MAQSIGCPAAFFWSADSLYHRVRPLPEIRKAIADYEWGVEDVEPEPPVVIPDLPALGRIVVMHNLEVQIDNEIYENVRAIGLTKKE